MNKYYKYRVKNKIDASEVWQFFVRNKISFKAFWNLEEYEFTVTLTDEQREYFEDFLSYITEY